MRSSVLVPRIGRAARVYLETCDFSLSAAIAGLLVAADEDDARRYVRIRGLVEGLLDQVDREAEPRRFVVGTGVVDAVRDAVRALGRPVPVAVCRAATCPPDHVVLETRSRR